MIVGSLDKKRNFVIPMKKGATTSSEMFIPIRVNRVTFCSKGWNQLLYKNSSDGILAARRKMSGIKSITL
jgi:hypothetical protein